MVGIPLYNLFVLHSFIQQGLLICSSSVRNSVFQLYQIMRNSVQCNHKKLLPPPRKGTAVRGALRKAIRGVIGIKQVEQLQKKEENDCRRRYPKGMSPFFKTKNQQMEIYCIISKKKVSSKQQSATSLIPIPTFSF